MKYIILLKANADEEEREEEMGASDRKFTEANEKKVEVGHVIIVPNTETKVNVTAVGKDGVTAQDEEGNKYLVRHENVVTEDEQSEEEGSNEIEKEQREKIKISLDDMLNKKEHKKGTSLDTSKPQKKDDEEAEKKEKGEEKESSFKDEDSEDEDEDSDESKKKGEKKELPFKKKEDKEDDVDEKKESSSKKKDSKVEEVDESKKKGDESSFKEASEKEKSKDEKKETKEDETTVEGYLNKNYTQNAWINPSDIAKLMDIERSEVDKQLMELSERGIVQLQAEQKTGEKLYKYVKAERAKEEAKANSYSKDPFDKKKVNPKHKEEDEGETKEVDLKKLVPSELWKKEDEIEKAHVRQYVKRTKKGKFSTVTAHEANLEKYGFKIKDGVKVPLTKDELMTPNEWAADFGEHHKVGQIFLKLGSSPESIMPELEKYLKNEDSPLVPLRGVVSEQFINEHRMYPISEFKKKVVIAIVKKELSEWLSSKLEVGYIEKDYVYEVKEDLKELLKKYKES